MCDCEIRTIEIYFHFRLFLHGRAHGLKAHNGRRNRHNQRVRRCTVLLLQFAPSDNVPQPSHQTERVLRSAVHPPRFSHSVPQDRRVHRVVFLRFAHSGAHGEFLSRVDAAAGSSPLPHQRAELPQRCSVNYILLALQDRNR